MLKINQFVLSDCAIPAKEISGVGLMTITIFHTESGATEKWLQVNEDETATYHVEKTGWPMMRGGTKPQDTHYTVEEAKSEWKSYANDIDAAVAKIRSAKSD